MKFIKRTTAPSKDNKYYLRPDKGFNKCIRGNTKHGINYGRYDVLPNCTGYCYGRFLESQHKKECDLPTSNAETWLDKNKIYQEGWGARVGSILVFAKGKVGNADDGAGHVVFVEDIDQNGTLLVSQSGWSAKKRMWTQKIKLDKKGGYTYSSKYKYLGCIYSPTNFEQSYYGLLPTVNLKYGDKGKQVKRLQEFLNWCLGETLVLDSHYGPATRNAVKKYQEIYKLQVDGKFGPKCRKKAIDIKL